MPGWGARACTPTSRSAAPCVGAVTPEEYQGLVDELLGFLEGESAPVLDRLDKQMHEAADALEFERAARVRDQITSVRKAIERQQMVAPKEEDLDVIAIAEDPLEAAVQVFFVRRGRVVGRKGFVVDKVEDLDPPALMVRLLEQLYAAADPEDVPREVLVPVAPDDVALAEAFLATVRGGPVRVRVPQRGAKRELLGTVTHNAEEAFLRHKLRRASDHNARARALTALQEALELPGGAAAHRVLRHLEPAGHRDRRVDGGHGGRAGEAVRLPAVQGAHHRRSRRLRVDGGGAHAPLPPVPRRTRRGGPLGKRFAYPPNLLVVDGGRGQLNVAVRVLEELGLEDICVASLAKRFEEVYLPGREEPVRIPATRRRCSCSSRSGTRRTASRSRTTASCAGRRRSARCSTTCRSRSDPAGPPPARAQVGEGAAGPDRGGAGGHPVVAGQRRSCGVRPAPRCGIAAVRRYEP